jgi:hypothetical protein
MPAKGVIGSAARYSIMINVQYRTNLRHNPNPIQLL